MAYAFPGAGALDYFPCHYGASRLLFRGPRRALEGDYIAMIGGTETYGKYVPTPFSALVEERLGIPVANLGCMNAGPDVFLNEAGITDVAQRAAVTVVQILGAANLSNRYYGVHPRRNDRFLGATPLLRSIFREVDFTEFSFTRHMLTTLQASSADRFEVVAEELRAAWVSRMKQLLQRIPGQSVLLWMSHDPPPAPTRRADLAMDPMLIDAEMVNAIRPLASWYEEVVSSPAARTEGSAGMVFAPMEAPIAAELPGPRIHREVADQLAKAIQQLL